MSHLAKPMNMHPNDDAIPYAVFAPVPTPPHWRDTVTDQLMDDIDSKVLRKLPVGEVNEWCARMVVVRKKDGRPRRTVDYQKLNQQCKRQA